MQQFKKFCLIGGIGFIVDSLFFLLLMKLTSNIMLVRLLSFWLAASATWLGNRKYTFKHQQTTNAFAQWGKHMLTAHLSGVINLLVFWGTKDTLPIFSAFCLGILTGLISNYCLSKKVVYVPNS